MQRTALLNQLNELKAQFEEASQQAQAIDRNLGKDIDEFNQGYAQCVAKMRTNLAQDKENPLALLVSALSDNIQKTVGDWRQSTNALKEGYAMRNSFNDSLMIYAYGKVKSGKSSLGNYFAWGNTNPDDAFKAQYRQAHPDFAPVYKTVNQADVQGGDPDGDAQKNMRFRVGETEATSSIQSFTLPGLTWIDSPGLHSVQNKNEALAKQYVSHADLIIYTTSSTAPARATDLKEIDELRALGKNMLVIITGCDGYEEDIDDNGDLVSTLVMKTDQVRTEQKAYAMKAINDVLREHGLRDLTPDRFLTISALYAQKHAQDEREITHSGMSAFFDEVVRVSQTEGVTEKKIMPLKNYLNYLVQSQAKLKDISDSLDLFKQQFEQARTSINNQKLTKLTQAKISFDDYLESVLYLSLEARSDEASVNDQMKKITTQIQNELTQRVVSFVNEALASIISSINSSIQNSALTDIKIPEFKNTTITKQYIHYEPPKRSIGMIVALAGGVGGFLLGGPIGATIGAGLGASAGSYLGRGKTSSNSLDVKVGDNYSEITTKSKRIYSMLFKDMAESTFNKNIDQLMHAFTSNVTELSNLIFSMRSRLAQAERETRNQIATAREGKDVRDFRQSATIIARAQ